MVLRAESMPKKTTCRPGENDSPPRPVWHCSAPAKSSGGSGAVELNKVYESPGRWLAASESPSPPSAGRRVGVRGRVAASEDPFTPDPHSPVCGGEARKTTIGGSLG